MYGKILVIAGSDSGGGAGIQADIKTINNLGGYATTAITALTAQNSETITEILPINVSFILKQIGTICADINIDAVKIGMVYDFNSLYEIIDILKKLLPNKPIILDPVLISSTGVKLSKFTHKSLNLLRTEIIANCYLITPNIAEAEVISNMKITNLDEMVIAGQIIQKLGAKNILLKGSHLEDKVIHDILITNNLLKIYESKKIAHQHNHGSGCALAAAISTLIAQENTIELAVEKARKYVYQAIDKAIIPGNGAGTLNHFCTNISAV
ncbi:MAG: bifunctional hydroxymethylpyrimidine kinase/phosphomethylpyrimidine kinase [Rickettsiales bacterium]